MAEPGGGARLAHHPGPQGGPLLVADRGRQLDLLDGHGAPEGGVRGPPYHADATLTELRPQLVPAGDPATNDVLHHAAEPYRNRADLATPQPSAVKERSNCSPTSTAAFQPRSGDRSRMAYPQWPSGLLKVTSLAR